ncbi:bile salt-activated lipase [Culex quinquefasciatus]|uniref:Carboxylic ester hydrolase n=1 Tax=Culex quinquefasciatus TaxID=7176 RepID=B0WLA8_CULQU|nr:bile salt-activated lipase [Culex quinquefasciatus]|eukprot:XP_001849492.1 bile salt-activated lipase [Culex quinquefasciatus]
MDGRHTLSASGATSTRDFERVLAEIGPGKLLGVVERLPSGAVYFVFKGIPYAKAPVGELRFQPPQLLPQLPFSPLDCAQDAPECFTVDNYLPNDQMSEDCLHLNVFTPSLPSKPPSETPQLPVMVWFHGGGFVTGSAQSSMYGAKHLVQEGVVVVTVNYRLGPLGFLCLPDVGIHGNMGLKDQRMSLAWVRENIKGFGGNPDNVTIFGQSAGGSSVHLHYLSENSRPLFHKAIAQSGTAFNQWVLQKDPDGRARRLAKLLGCKDENNDALVYDCLLTASPKKITDLQYQVMTSEERSVVVNFPFNTQLIKKKLPKSIPIMMGIMSEEGVALASHVLSSLDLYKQTLETQLLPFALDVADEKISKDAFSSIKKFFFKEQALSIETVPNLVQVLGDNANKFAGYLSAELHNLHQSSPLYFYIFSYMSELNKLRELSQAPASCPGAAHGDDLCYLFS